MKQLWNKFGAYLVALVIFIVLSLVYCKPVLDGKRIETGDSVAGICAVNEALTHNPEDGEYGFWNGSMFSGMPNYQIGGGHYKSSDLMRPLLEFFHKGHNETIWIFILYFICFFVFLRSFGIDKWICLVGSIAITFSSYFIVVIAAGHNGKTSTIALMTVVSAGFYLIFRKKYALGAIFTMFFTAMGFSTHPQMSYYIIMMTGLFFLAELYTHIKEKRIKDLLLATCIFAAAFLIGLGTGASNIFANKEYAEQTMRGGHSDLVSENETAEQASSQKGLDIEYATQWSYGIDETMSFLIPGFMGGSSAYPLGTDSGLYKALVKKGIGAKVARSYCQNAPIYWGDQPFTSGNVYMGAIVCFLFILGLLVVKGPYKWALLAATVFSTVLAWGHNCMWFTELFFNYFPLYNKFRAVSSILIVAEIAMPLLGFMAVSQIVKGETDRKQMFRDICIAGGATSAVCLFFAIFGTSMFDFKSIYDSQFTAYIPDWVYAAIIDQRMALLRSDSFRSFIFIAAAAAVLLLFVKGKLKSGWTVAILGVLIVADMWPVDKRYLNDNNFQYPKESQEILKPTPYEEQILEDSDPHFRVFNLTTDTFNDARTSCYLKSIGGYHAAKLRRYQDLIEVHLSKLHYPVIGMLNAKYLIMPGEDGTAQVRHNPYALGNAWYVDKILVADSPNAEMDSLNTIDLKTVAITDREYASFVSDFNPGIAADAKVTLTKYQPRCIDYKCTSSQPGTIVFSEIHYPYGWKASIDGEPADHFRVNYILRAMNVPAGTHDIHFEFDPDSVKKGDALALVCIIIMYLFTAGAIALAARKKILECRK